MVTRFFIRYLHLFAILPFGDLRRRQGRPLRFFVFHHYKYTSKS
ncbi:hypothetical protein GBL_2534 [Geobacillus kaustophilus GBlys]|uniref:Uncharacterized protein n=1 Tax=Geobacillus kaustophilus GBlys TaxID=1337888 RepID=S4NMX8_GEOKU|nr:hypothetical protein GBL_2534 [Geobacillus kaustophilus GBlys]